MRFTTQKAALCSALLDGDVLTIMEAFTRFGITNLPREIGRSVERAFGVTINKHRTTHTNMFGEEGHHFVYRLTCDKECMYFVSKEKRSAHRKGLKLMRKYVDEHSYPERIIMPSKKKRIDYLSKAPIDQYAPKTWPGFPSDQITAYYVREEEKSVISPMPTTIKDIITNSVPYNKTAADYTRQAAEEIIPRSGKTTAQIIRDSLFTKKQIAKQKRKKK